MVGLVGFEPTVTGSEPAALPLGYSPTKSYYKKMAGPAWIEHANEGVKVLCLTAWLWACLLLKIGADKGS